MTTSTLAAEQIFLLPNGTIFVEIILFLIVVLIFTKWIVPPLSKAMQDRQDMVRKQAEDREESARRLKEAEERYEKAMVEARTEAAAIRDEARADAQRIRDEMRAETDREVARIHAQGEEQLAAQRAQAVSALRAEIGGLSTDLAGRILGSPLPSDGDHRSTVDRFLAELEQKQTAEGAR
ncbi:F0F1 ATP synthase subunit B [Pseudonocardia sp. GCM10023141]|uniref:F0F1 ATP synthase subunit B n=1 Tax=Pseudonocardia sp. GCM10023141 TaxID=3252653 RepID=UPI00360C2D59